MRKVVIVGCGNPLRGDDGVGPRFVRYLWERGLPPNVKLVDGGTSGIDVIFHMENADEVIIVDACSTDQEPGTIFCVPSEEVEELPTIEEANLHSIKWYHAIALAKYLLNGKYPRKVSVYLIEGKNFEIGEDLSLEVKKAMEELADYVMKMHDIQGNHAVEVELTEEGYIVIPSHIANKYFSDCMSVLVVPKGMQFTIIPLPTNVQGGLLLKRINKEGCKAVLVWELLPAGISPGKKKAVWDEEERGLVVSLM
ncbi:hydrogenase maturation protease [Hydrogenobacter thermophilus]|uniref:hydrogenase maturation protease n=1 Tax=Hydrogenobacter thermophilus TaxID=940 RepID=UPI0030FC2404